MAGRSLELRPISSADRDALRTFSCSGWNEPWADLAEEMIRGPLLDAVRLGDADAIGAWDGPTLAGVAARRVRADRCTSIVLAVAHGYRRRGIARALKLAMIEAARAGGAAVIVSLVHWDNAAMLFLNLSLGANIERLPGDLDYSLCVMPIPARRAAGQPGTDP